MATTISQLLRSFWQIFAAIMFSIVLVNDGSAFVGYTIEIGVAAAMNRSGSFMVYVKKWQH